MRKVTDLPAPGSRPKDHDARASGDRTFLGNATISNPEYASPAQPGLSSVFLSVC
jgi:hypothetical protein